MSNQEGVMSFEEYYLRSEPYTESEKDRLKLYWNAARQGMIPAANAIQIPDEWPKWSKEIRVFFSNGNEKDHKGEMIQIIKRPKPQWTPEVGEAAFWFFESKIHIVRISQIFADKSISIKTLSDSRYASELRSLKPFDPAKIGLSWEQI